MSLPACSDIRLPLRGGCGQETDSEDGGYICYTCGYSYDEPGATATPLNGNNE